MGDDVVQFPSDVVAGAFLGHASCLLTLGEDRPEPLGLGDALLGLDERRLTQSSAHRIGGDDQAETHRRGEEPHDPRGAGGVVVGSQGVPPAQRPQNGTDRAEPQDDA